MGSKTTVVCDQCGAIDIDKTRNGQDWYVSINNRLCYTIGNVVRGVQIDEPISGGEKTFCGAPCMAVWVIKNFPLAASQYNRMMEMRKLERG